MLGYSILRPLKFFSVVIGISEHISSVCNGNSINSLSYTIKIYAEIPDVFPKNDSAITDMKILVAVYGDLGLVIISEYSKG